mgnify:FL=1
MKDLKVFVIHYTALKKRKEFLLNEFSKHSINYHFIEDYDRDKLLKKDLKIFHTKLPKYQCAISLSHIDAYQKILNSNYKYNLIFEDDVILDDKFQNKLENGLKQLPDDYDMLFIGNGCGFHIKSSIVQQNKFIYKKCVKPTSWGGNGGTRCTDSYLVSKKCAKKLKKYILTLKNKSIKLPVDWWLNNVIRYLNLKIYWMEPTIVTQGTRTGKYKTSQ